MGQRKNGRMEVMEPLNPALDRKIYSLTTDYLGRVAATTWRSIGRRTGSHTWAGLEWASHSSFTFTTDGFARNLE